MYLFTIEITRYYKIFHNIFFMQEKGKHSHSKGKDHKDKIHLEALKVQPLNQRGPHIQKISKILQEQSAKACSEAGSLSRSIEAYFIGPRGQNIPYFSDMIKKAIDKHWAARTQYEMEDPRHITRKMKNQDSYLDAQDRLDRAFNVVLTNLKDLSPPFYSSRYFGHMNWETTIPSILGNFATLLYNPNNCAFEGGPYTTLLQIEVMKQFAILFGYPKLLQFDPTQQQQREASWGHLTCGGTIANCEAFWAARNVRFLTLSLRRYIQNTFSQNTNEVKDVKVHLANGTEKKLLQLSGWEIMNIPNDETMQLYDRIFKTIYPNKDDQQKNYSVYQSGVAEFAIGKIGLIDMYYWIDQINQALGIKTKMNRPKGFISAAAHYSIRKSFSILGFGEKAAQKIEVDLDSRICIQKLQKRLNECIQSNTPVLAVVGIVGTTEESTVDNLCQIHRLQKQFSAKGLYFHFHIDGAYGGYFVATIRQRQPKDLVSFSPYVLKQLQGFHWADSITFDPHKTGYVPYACGGIIYRNHRLRDNLSFSAPYIYTGAEPNMAIYGIQGSKPGSSVTSVYLSLQVLPLVRKGHGELLERTMMNTKIFTASLYRIKEIDITYDYQKQVENGSQLAQLNQFFDCFMLSRLLCEKLNIKDPVLFEKVKKMQMEAIYKISTKGPQDIFKTLEEEPDYSFDRFYYNLGPDMNIVCYGLNYMTDPVNKVWNKSLKNFNQFNKALIRLSKPVGSDISVRMKSLYVSQTQINKHTYGQQIFNDYLKRHGLQAGEEEEIVFIRSTIMNAFFVENAGSFQELNVSNKVFVSELLQNACQTLLQLKLR